MSESTSNNECKFNIISSKRSDFAYNQVFYVLECKNCGRIIDVRLDIKDNINNKVKCECENYKESHIKLDSNVDFKLKRTWKRLYNDMCSDWKESFDRFSDWAYSNGYKPWLNLVRKDNKKEYSEENCYFKLNKLIYSKEYLDKMDSNRSKAVCLIGNINNRVGDICNNYTDLKDELSKLRESSEVDNSTVEEIEKELKKINRTINKVRELSTYIDLKK